MHAACVVPDENRAPASTAGLTSSIIDQVRAYELQTLPADVTERAKHCLLDWIGVTLSGSREPLTEILLAESIADGGHGHCTVLGRAERVTAAQACLVNGAAGHSQDYDDVLEMMLGHPTATVAPVVFALGEREQFGGADVIAAFVAGLQAEGAIGVLVEPHHHEQGWHTTATLGVFGAAAAACHLLKLEDDAWNRAFGLAATHAGGLKSMFGTMAKPFHAGKAAVQGYRCASLAARGLTSALNVLEIPRGFVEVTTPAARPDAESLRPDRYAIREVLFKEHAACYLTHSAIAGVLDLVGRHRIAVDNIDRIDVQTLPVHGTTCAAHDARTGLEAKFSIEYSIAVAVRHGRAGEAEFSDEIVGSSPVRELAGRVVLHEGDWPLPQLATPVRIATRDGRTHDALVDISQPASEADLPAQWARLVDKFAALALPVVGARRVDQILTLVRDLDQLSSLNQLVALLREPLVHDPAVDQRDR